MRSFRRSLFMILITVSVVLILGYHFFLVPRRVTPVLMYHSISTDRSSTLNVTPDNFTRQMRFLSDHGYRVISLDELVRRIEKGVRYSPGTVAVTFDDGFENNYLNAFPVLADHDMPATIFVITGYVGEKKEYLRWDQIRVMLEHGIDIGVHTKDNVYLPSVREKEQLREQIRVPRKEILENTGHEPDFFCYPTGGFTPQIKTMVKKAGYKAAFTTNRGTDRQNRDLFELNRVKVTNSDTSKFLHFRAKLSGFYNVFRSTKKGY